MGLQLPDWLREALAYLGMTWPEADETALFECGQAWLSFCRASGDHAELANGAVDDMLQDNHSPGLDAFEKYWARVGGEDGHLPDSGIASGAIAASFFAAAGLVLLLKVLVIVQLIAMAIILAAAIAAAFFTLGSSLAAAASAAVRIRATITTLVQATITAIQELGPPLSELAEEHLSKEIQRLDGRPIHHSEDRVDEYMTPEERAEAEREYEERWKDLAYDPKKKQDEPREADTALGLEATGKVKGPVTRAEHEGADFTENTDPPQDWDVKSYRSQNYDRKKIERDIMIEIKASKEKVALDTADLTAEQRADLQDLVGEMVRKNSEWNEWIVMY